MHTRWVCPSPRVWRALIAGVHAKVRAGAAAPKRQHRTLQGREVTGGGVAQAIQAPKRAMSAYMYFANHMRPQISKAKPDLSVYFPCHWRSLPGAPLSRREHSCAPRTEERGS